MQFSDCLQSASLHAHCRPCAGSRGTPFAGSSSVWSDRTGRTTPGTAPTWVPPWCSGQRAWPWIRSPFRASHRRHGRHHCRRRHYRRRRGQSLHCRSRPCPRLYRKVWKKNKRPTVEPLNDGDTDGKLLYLAKKYVFWEKRCEQQIIGISRVFDFDE